VIEMDTSPTAHPEISSESGSEIRPAAGGAAGSRDTGRDDFRRELGQQLRVDSVRCSAAAGSGHPTSSMSAADLMAVLLDGYLRLDLGALDDPRNDHLIFSKGHASPLYYAMLVAAGSVSEEELLTFRRMGSRLEGHPTPRIPPTDVATGSLGQGLPIGVGIAEEIQRLEHVASRVWVLCGDSELAEGSIWEAFQHAGWAGLDRLTVTIDVNRLGQTRQTMLGWDLEAYVRRAEAFDWHAITVDGHDVAAIDSAYAEAVATVGRPTVVIAHTIKGKGVAAVENQNGKHGKPLEDPEGAIAELGGVRHLRVGLSLPPGRSDGARSSGSADADVVRIALPSWPVGESVATRQAYGEALTALGDVRDDVVALDGEVSNSTGTEAFARAHPERYFEMFIAEQQLVASAVGMSVRGRVAFASTFAAFLTRAYDFIRMAAVSRADLRLVGSHAGVSIGEDGPSQMALEDIAMMRAVHGSAVLHPSDANQTAQLLAEMADRPGISYLRTLRGATTVRTPPEEPVRIGGSRLVRSGEHDDVTIVACGVTVDEAVAASVVLRAEGIEVRILDCYSVEPIDAAALRAAAGQTRLVVTVEDHWPQGGLGEAVAAALAQTPAHPPVVRLAVRTMPASATPREQRALAGIDAEAIAATVRAELSRAEGEPHRLSR